MGQHVQRNPRNPKSLAARLGGGTRTPRWAIGAVVAAVIVLVGGVVVGVLASRSPGGAVVAAAPPGANHRLTAALTRGPVPPIQVVSVTPANGASGVIGSTSVSVTFSRTLSATTPLPSLTPGVAGQWSRVGPTLTFKPGGAFLPLASETLTIPGGANGVLSAAGATLPQQVVAHFSVANGSVLRLQQLMSILDYSPLSWTPTGAPIAAGDTAAQAAAAFTPPAGTFAWRQAGWPTNLTALWQPGTYNQMTKGLVMAFEADHGLTVDGIAGPQVWSSLLRAVAANQVNTGGYNFALASEARPETLTIWHNGAQVFHNLANTGIAQAPTALGTFNVYERLRNQVMRGTNPDGSTYADPVQYVAYFNGGDAVHYIYRYSYGYPQSLGCVELPLQAASVAWPYLSYGTVVQVVG